MDKYSTLFICGIFYIVYGICGICGVQHIAEEYQNRSWTKQYKRYCGLTYFVLGISWLWVLFVAVDYDLPENRTIQLLLAVSVAPIVFSFCKDKIFDRKLKAENEIESC